MTDELRKLEADLQAALARPLNSERRSWLERLPIGAALTAGACGCVAGLMAIGAGVGWLTGAKF